MKINFQLLLLSITITIFSMIQSDAQKWHQIEEESITSNRSDLTREIVPKKYKTYTISMKSMRTKLEKSPDRFKNDGSASIIMDIPIADGTFEQFSMTRSDVFHPDLAARYPLIKSYTGNSLIDPTSILKLSISHKGINGMILSDSRPTVYIDRYAKEMDDIYIVYYKNDFSKHLHDGEGHCTIETPDDNFVVIDGQAKYGDCQLRRYRLALACTGEYATFHGGNKLDVLAEYNASLTRLNGIYERESAITMQLIANTDELIYLNSGTDPYTNNEGGTMLGENQANIDQVIGFNNYDIGHVYSTGGGGIASLRSPCTTRKAQGVTGLGNPTGDPFWVDYVAHEMGHQFGGNHTQNNDCNRSQNTAVEPGSASTIMGYAGICSPNVQNNSDDYFHSVTIEEFTNFVVGGNGDCAETLTIDNNAPELMPLLGNGLVLPISTPFELMAVATDADNDAITYCWEQQDNETAPMPPESTATGGPAFRSYNPTTSPSRFFPRMSSILLGNNGNTWETLPSVNRSMNFNITVRDNNALGGCTADDDLSVTFTDQAGPFAVTSQNATSTWNAGATETISWDVANTDQSPVSCAEVNIYLSLDGGDNFDIMLAENTENDGMHEVQVPFQFSDECRIKIKCATSIFLDVNDSDFSIIPSFSSSISPESVLACMTETANYTIDYTEFAEDIVVTFSIEGLPIGAVADFSTNPVTEDGLIDLIISGLENVEAGEYPLVVTSMSPDLTFDQDITLIVSPEDAPNVEYLFPMDAETNVPVFPTLTWQDYPAIIQYEAQLSDNPSFENILITQMTDQPSTTGLSLESQMVYYWRVRAISDCFESDWNQVQSFQTAGLTCINEIIEANIEIPENAATITSTATVTSTDILAMVEMTIKINHTYVGDLIATLESPSGTLITLFDRPGVPASNFGCGNNNIAIQLSDFAMNTAEDLENSCEPGNLAISGNFQPIDPFSNFNGENMEGTWTLFITDTFDDDNGELVEWSLSTCSSAPIMPAIIINNNDLILQNQNEKIITNEFLLVENNDPENVFFVLRTAAQNGNLQRFNHTAGMFENMMLGSVFTQYDIDEGDINYVVTNVNENSDSFTFDVADDQVRYAANQLFNISFTFEGLVISTSITNAISCFGDNDGEITASGSGGIAPLTYSIDGASFSDNKVFSNLVPDTYAITVRDDNGAETTTNPIIISEPTQLEVTTA
ncbi:MAG: subtilisin-like proprotein convertase family protein, partial [Halioglobus sp.]